MKRQKVCKRCGAAKSLQEFRPMRRSCRKCCYETGKHRVIVWKQGRQEYVNSQYTTWRRKHPLSRKLSVIRKYGATVRGLLPILEKMYREYPFCEYCKTALNVDDASLDHKTPIARGGAPCDPDNWAVCCKDCNYLKGGKTAEEFKSFVVDYAKRFLANAEPSRRESDGVTVSPEITDINAPALG